MRNRFIFVFFIFLNVTVGAQQICTGNLGENIFSIGDFGSGEANIIQVDPMIAPQYTYTTAVPPGDGFYVITNDMTGPAWGGLFETWLAISDNSEDPDGYMMVVNASFEPGIFYEEIVDGLCENTLYEFSADVINLIRPGVGGHHEPNLSFLLDDEELYSSGIIAQDGNWKTQGFTFVTASDQTSVKLTLRNNAPGGIGNDLALDNISFRPCGPSAFANAAQEFLLCANDIDPIEIRADTDMGSAIQWQVFSETTMEWTDIPGAIDIVTFHAVFDPGEYQYRYFSAGNASNLLNERCRVISDVATVTVLPIEFEVIDTICEGVAYEFGSQLIMEEGFYQETFTASSGCDSFVDLFLFHEPDPRIVLEVGENDPSCYGYDDGLLQILSVSRGIGPYSYYLDDEEGDLFFPNLSAGMYTIEVRDKFSCSTRKEVSLIDPELFVVSLGNDTVVEFGDVYNFEIDANYDVIAGMWSGGITECQTCLENSAQPFETTTYVFSAENESLCSASDSVIVRVQEVGNLFYKPTIFSPNADGVNDKFTIFTGTNAISEVKNFSVFDRLGNLVYKVENREGFDDEWGWDGMMNGKPAAEGVYAYFYNFLLINDSEILISGDVTLVR